MTAVDEFDVTVNGGVVVCEWVGPEDGEIVVLTPGGRFSKDYAGVRELAEGIAQGGNRVLLWDRPNCGRSDIQLFGRSESHMRAATLAGVVEELGLGPVNAFGGSAGARDTVVFALEYPHLVKKMAIWNIVGGTFSSMSLAGNYSLPELKAVRFGGIERVMAMDNGMFSWKTLMEANPRNRQRLLDIGAEGFERVIERWFEAFIPKANEPMPGISEWQFQDIKVPTLIIRGGAKDMDHPKATSLYVHALIRGSVLVDPPWPEDAWEQAVRGMYEGKGSLFDPWLLAAPVLIDFLDGKPAANPYGSPTQPGV